MPHIMTSSGLMILVDDEDFAKYGHFRWCASVVRKKNVTKYYAKRKTREVRDLYLHRLIAGAQAGQMVDHINGDSLDNRRSNLRICNPSQNATNSDNSYKNTTGFRGIEQVSGRWRAKLRSQGKNYYLGTYDTKEEAARAYDAGASRLHGEFARLNWSASNAG